MRKISNESVIDRAKKLRNATGMGLEEATRRIKRDDFYERLSDIRYSSGVSPEVVALIDLICNALDEGII